MVQLLQDFEVGEITKTENVKELCVARGVQKQTNSRHAFLQFQMVIMVNIVLTISTRLNCVMKKNSRQKPQST
jgi:hypothetical protein